MFNGNKGRSSNHASPTVPPAPPMPPAGNNKRGMFSVIGPDVVVTGNISATADLHIDGRVDGDVNCGALAQGADSQIFGNVKAESARLAGSIEGTVSVKQLTVERSAKITGDVEYENITIENGGHIDGRLKHMSAVDVAAPERPRAVETGSENKPSVFSTASEGSTGSEAA
ncbi:bactofilin family protein [Stakelama tenebrarum]|uniref:Polymer-forming cytoskeletal protein n=1 Tax=Stakelama tenebrarum TaxID=2711215 RepID=A0A6G6Y9M6_9SPHN|nr:polymer-forming cytoskeletal protein [Sphingosinithalassobacter tenebrarum]QIG81276.1 polymer-forming cytoskeletal protein [Sphingosinithalassobacter tenebrarum]